LGEGLFEGAHICGFFPTSERAAFAPPEVLLVCPFRLYSLFHQGAKDPRYFAELGFG
jgi:hypothetical protein